MVRPVYYPGTMARRSGYTLIELLIVTGLLITLATIGTVTYLEALRQAKENRAYTKLAELAALEQIYFQNFDRYATFAELQDQGYIAAQYVEDDVLLHNQTVAGQPAGAFIADYELEFVIQSDTFRITASASTPQQAVAARWRLAGRQPDVRAMYVTEDSVVRLASNSRPVK